MADSDIVDALETLLGVADTAVVETVTALVEDSTHLEEATTFFNELEDKMDVENPPMDIITKIKFANKTWFV
jgi:hypothetical protein